jgi:exopolysaccharide biosynthesis polyprenyl glycosylphosphotransferase
MGLLNPSTTEFAAPVSARHAAMRRPRQLPMLPLAIVGADLVIVSVSALVATASRVHLSFLFDEATDVDAVVRLVGAYLVTAWLVVLAIAGAYAPSHLGAGTLEYKRVLSASAATAGFVGIVCYLAKFQLSRGFFVLFFAIGTPVLIISRHLLRRVIHALRSRGRLLSRVVIAGSPQHVDEVASVIDRESWLGYEMVGALTPVAVSDGLTPGGVSVIGRPSGLVEALQAAKADVVIFAAGAFSTAADFRRAVWALEERRVQVIVVPSLTDVSEDRIRVRPVAGLPLVHLERPQSQQAGRWLKRSFDVIGSAALLVFASPVLLAVALAVRFHDGGPVLFRQTRVGRDGREFECLKFRSMEVNAEQRLDALNALRDGGNTVLFKMVEDPRITRPGRIIRRFSLDELPQLWNVLQGDMSLVGPRPPLPHEVEQYHSDVMRRLRVRPGMTGLWQVSGRSDLSWEETVRLDLYYVDNWSMVQDLAILARTLQAVLGSRGAY